MIRPTLVSETAMLQEIARGTGVFKPHEIEMLAEVLKEYHEIYIRQGHQAVNFEINGKTIGFAYFAPTWMTDRTWHLHWIFVEKQTHAKGIGTKLLKYAEDHVAQAGGRQLLIETSSLPSYEPTRKFYLKHGYKQAAQIPDFYADGDDQIIFHKRLSHP